MRKVSVDFKRSGIPRSTDGNVRVLFLSYGKDSLACLFALEELGWPLDRIVNTEVWATDSVQAEFPEVVEFQRKVDRYILLRWGICVEHFRANSTYEKELYRKKGAKSKRPGEIIGFPVLGVNWCNGALKRAASNAAMKSASNGIQYLGIAYDEPSRFHNLSSTKISPLVELGWTEKNAITFVRKTGYYPRPIKSRLGPGVGFVIIRA